MATVNEYDYPQDEITQGAIVKLRGLIKAAHYNGRMGIVTKGTPKDAKDGRRLVRLIAGPSETSSDVRIKVENMSIMCSKCRKNHAIGRCPNCKVPCYCSEECQRSAWPAHKDKCKETMKKLSNSSQPGRPGGNTPSPGAAANSASRENTTSRSAGRRAAAAPTSTERAAKIKMEAGVSKLMAMGFTKEQCTDAYRNCDGDVETASNLLLDMLSS
uniref:MYND-type domain-containing protein n=1 Tax=Octactis speculum TaxID=3111310 RepID=A0A7S2HSL3_9STRA|mmetsp:Transcript_9128/g.11679  ORF Transcript_9128/g.11679 Transcript_9128/m.11679 type:complete len:215 (+) Transcript_9128:181-825(+)|eukprot:CAMPEP_0185748960 /NCGR_PEP_ID=MMETSP1174-20130828/7696_1 /TAXON_ID=35687 /ORGANISM="Dictyocha speculum, Strain CCMP1381" /LENGTH=214 /DNA_ID=CAMNT_0028424879 /DNA_START=168 /DNA_END=812 /DNA_ORIENTATION=+